MLKEALLALPLGVSRKANGGQGLGSFKQGKRIQAKQGGVPKMEDDKQPPRGCPHIWSGLKTAFPELCSDVITEHARCFQNVLGILFGMRSGGSMIVPEMFDEWTQMV